jgi:DNA-binding MarR family transcriptional regulator
VRAGRSGPTRVDEALRHHGRVPTPRPQDAVERELTRLLRRFRRALSAYAVTVHPGLDVAGYSLLLAIVDAEAETGAADVRVAALEERLQLHKSTLSRGLAGLEQLGMVRRVADPGDARARLVRLTADGMQRLGRVQTQRLAVLARVLDSWRSEDLAALGALLERLNTDLEQATATETDARAGPRDGGRGVNTIG